MRITFWQENEHSIIRALSLDTIGTVDTDGFYFDRFIPGDYVERECVHDLDNGDIVWHDNGLPGRYFQAWPVFYCDCGESFELKGK